MISLNLIPITFEELKPLLYFSFSGDDDLIKKYQKDDLPYTECMEYILGEIKENLAIYQDDMYLWKVELEGNGVKTPIGYTVTVDSVRMLFSFGINIVFRKNVFLLEWLEIVAGIMGGCFYTALWHKNQRAMDFFKRNGFEEIAHTKNPFSYLIKKDCDYLKQYAICQ